MRAKVALLGASGYSGAVLEQLLLRHPGVTLTLAARERLDAEAALLRGGGAEVVLLATPAEVSLELAPPLLAAGARVLDLSGAFRLGAVELAAETYGLAYGDAARAALAEALWVIPELADEATRARRRQVRLLANPGCYVTAALLALCPLARAGLLLPGAPLFVDGKSGASGAGRKAALELSLCELEGELRPYRLDRHQHTPEMRRGLLPLEAPLRFVPQILGTRRGLLTTCHGQLAAGVGAGEVAAAYQRAYAGCPRVHVVPPEQVTLRRPVGGADAFVGAQVHEGTFCALGSLDNLLKGAASQALQNLNGMLGLPEELGLADLCHPC